MKGVVNQAVVVNRLREVLVEKGVTQGELARKIGRQRVQVCAMVNEEDPNPGIRLVLEIAAALGVAPGELYALPGDLPARAADGAR